MQESGSWRFPDDVRGWLTLAEATSLASLTRQKRVLELGSYCGRSTVAMAQNAAMVTAVDWFRGDAFTGECGEGWTLPEFTANLTRYGVTDRVEVRVGRIEDVGPTLVADYDVVFVDSSHDVAAVTRDLRIALNQLRPEGGILALHDWNQSAVQQAATAVLGWTATDGQGVTADSLHWRHIGERHGSARQQSVFLAIPHTGTVSGESLPGLIWATRRGKLTVAPGKISLLATNFNQLWCEALNEDEKEHFTHWAMHHSDIQAPNWWIDTLIDEMDRVGADVISVAVALKDERELTTTAVGSGDNSIRRLTLTDLENLPATFSISDIPGDEPNRRLLINTGLWVCRFRNDWKKPPAFPGFHLKDQIRFNSETKKYEALCLSEDWGISEWFHNHGLKVFATSIFEVTHYGVSGYSNKKKRTGRWVTDLGDARKDELPPGDAADRDCNSNGSKSSRASAAKHEDNHGEGLNMNENQLYEKIGRITAAKELAEGNYEAALLCMSRMLTGEIDNSRVIVNLTDKSFNWVAPGDRPPLPPTINGLPQCVVSSDTDPRSKADLLVLVKGLQHANDELAKRVDELSGAVPIPCDASDKLVVTLH